MLLPAFYVFGPLIDAKASCRNFLHEPKKHGY